MSKVFDISELFAAHCKATDKWGVMLHCDLQFSNPEDYTQPFETGNFFTDLKLAAPDHWKSTQAVSDGYSFHFGTEEQIQKIYGRTVGDDGSEVNPYKGPVRVYALTCDNKGKLRNENT